ncbi:ning recombination protein [Caudoviricetes sp.]|nr:ning recombination protein [Caudoviricetes sp.]
MNITKRSITPKGKKKRAKLSTLIAKADKLASQYIRRKYADHAGNVVCVSCGTVIHWKEAHCAHYIERGKKSTRWLEENLHPADASCNVYRKEFHMRGYTLFMIDTYGREFVNELQEMAKKTISSVEVRKLAEEAIEYYSVP